jgi:hypothetical protein
MAALATRSPAGQAGSLPEYRGLPHGRRGDNSCVVCNAAVEWNTEAGSHRLTYSCLVMLRSADARAALARWDRFPVDQEPRPVVLTGPAHALLERLWGDPGWRERFAGPGEPETALPPELRDAAVDYCRDVHTREPRPLAPIVHGHGPFGTDRGVREFPAWMMYPPDRRYPFIEMEPEFRRRNTWWPEGVSAHASEESLLAADGRTLTYRFLGTPVAYADYPHAEVYETDTAVLVQPVPADLTGPDQPVLEYLEVREVTVELAAPLGNRVLVWAAHGPGSDTFGAPRVVLTA